MSACSFSDRQMENVRMLPHFTQRQHAGVTEPLWSVGDFTFWLSPWLRLNTNLSTQLWS